MRKEGGLRWVQAHGEPIHSQSGKLLRIVGSAYDVTAAREALEDVLARTRDASGSGPPQRLHDELTGLPTRPLFVDHLRRALVRCVRSRESVALIVVDLDDFAALNDRVGFDGGDVVLRAVSKRLQEALRAGDLIGRPTLSARVVDSDEFLVLCEEIEEPHTGTIIADRLVGAVRSQPVQMDDRAIQVTASAGVALGDEQTTPEQVMQRAAEALRRAKARGGDRSEPFDIDARKTADTRRHDIDELQHAVGSSQLRLHYQPKVNLVTGRVAGVEALVRWEHPARGCIGPGDFIPLAEEAGLIESIGSWVLAEACRQRMSWATSPGMPASLQVCVNLSAQEFGSALPLRVARALEVSGMPPEWLCLEITESMVMHDVDAATQTTRELREIGVHLAVDDFGTGYSSLAYLKRFALDELKIDRSFISGLGENSEDTAIVAAIVAMGHALQLSVIAEGVETRDQAAHLRRLGCENAQGFLFARPVPATDIPSLLTTIPTLLTEGAHDRREQGDVVVVVDDDAIVLELASISLAAAGFQVHTARSAAEALTLVRNVRPACVLLDVVLPDGSGIEACRRLLALPEASDVDVIMLSGESQAARKIEAFEAGADDYILKPFSPRDLVGRIHAAAERRRDKRAPSPESQP